MNTSIGKDFHRFIVTCMEATKRDFQIYSEWRVWGGYPVHVKQVVEPIVKDEVGQAPDKRERKNWALEK